MMLHKMVILGLGSNLDDKIDNLRKALQYIRQIPHFSVTQVSPVYLSDALLHAGSPKSWKKPYLNLALRCETTLAPIELLKHTKNIEKLFGRNQEYVWGPRAIDIDLLAWNDLILYNDVLHIPHEQLHERPFAIWPLADVAPHWINPLPGVFQGKTAVEIANRWGPRHEPLIDAPLNTRQLPHRIDTPQLVGIVNVTPNSFSDGGKFLAEEHAFQQIEHLVAAGAEIIDIGAESTRPNAVAISTQEEWQRLEPVLSKILTTRKLMPIIPKISVDTRHSDTAKKALHLGVDWMNDVSGLNDLAMCDILKAAECSIVFMHHLGIPVNQQVLPLTTNVVTEVMKWAEERIDSLINFGIAKERLILDVGIGYGKTREQSLELIKNINAFKKFDLPLLLGHSRKSFLTQFTHLPPHERDLETLVISLNLEATDYLRVHDVAMHTRAFKVQRALTV